MIVQAGDAVLLHMNLLLSDGSLAETTRANNKPTRFQLGDGSLTSAIECELLGLAIGEKKKFEVSAENAFGERKPALIQYMQRFEFPADIQLSVGLIIGFNHPSGKEMPGIVRAIEGDSVTVDFNHPLAGEALTFDIEIVDIIKTQTPRSVTQQLHH